MRTIFTIYTTDTKITFENKTDPFTQSVSFYLLLWDLLVTTQDIYSMFLVLY